jgi:hypothetical protein
MGRVGGRAGVDGCAICGIRCGKGEVNICWVAYAREKNLANLAFGIVGSRCILVLGLRSYRGLLLLLSGHRYAILHWLF